MEGQISFFDANKPKTNFEVLMSCQTPEQFHKLYYEILNAGCRQHGANAKQIWKSLCLQEDYRGKDGCYKCKMEFMRMEYEGDN